jgi:mono/diheme cytochrome c family protein
MLESRLMMRVGPALRWFAAGVLVTGCARDQPESDTTTPAATPPRQTAPQPAPPVTGNQIVALGDSIFHGQVAGGICYTCHGPDAKGTQLGPNLTDMEWLNGDGSEEFIVRTVTNGVPAPKKYPGMMPPMGQMLSPDQVRAVAAYVYSLSRPPG